MKNIKTIITVIVLSLSMFASFIAYAITYSDRFQLKAETEKIFSIILNKLESHDSRFDNIDRRLDDIITKGQK